MSRKIFLSLTLLMLLLSACADVAPAPAPSATALPPEPAAERTADAAPQPSPAVAEEQLTAVAAEAAALEATPVKAEPTAEPTAAATTSPAAADLITLEQLANMSYSSEFTVNGSAPLVDGQTSEQAAPGSATETQTLLTTQVAYGDLSGQPAAAVVLVTDPGGSGTFYSLHVVGLQEDVPVELAAASLGDRVEINSLAITADQVIVAMVMAGPDDPLCCPTQQVVQAYELQGSELVRTANEVIGSSAEAAAGGLINRLWIWQERQAAGGSAQPIDQSAAYTLIFHADGSYQYTADCNRGAGLYTAGDAGEINFQPSIESLAGCGPGSQSEGMKETLRAAQTYRRDNGALALVWGDESIIDTYVDGGLVVPDESGLEIDAGQISVDTQGLYETWTAVEVPARPVDASAPPGARGLPDHIEITFDNLNPAEQRGAPIMRIIPVEAYLELWEIAGNDAVAGRMDQIYEFARRPLSQPPTSGVPVLPVEQTTGANDMATQIRATGAGAESAAQTGYRFVGRFAQSANPLTNQELRYIYQGFTNDGKYLVTFFNPARSDALPDDPTGLTQAQLDAFSADTQGQLAAEAQRLDALPPDGWQPDLAALDALVNSLRIEGMPSAGLQDTTWTWSGQVSDPASGEVNELAPQGAHTALYDQDLLLSFVADCNLGSSGYELGATGMIGTMRAQPAVSALVECGEGSFSQQFAAMLAAANGYRLLPGGSELILSMPDGGDYLLRDSGEPSAVDSGGPGADIAPPIALEAGTADDLVAAGITLDVTGVAKTYEWQAVPAQPIPPGPGGQGYPRHVLLTFDGENPQEGAASNDPSLRIFPILPYISLYEAAGRDVVSDQVSRLQQLIGSAQGRPMPPSGWMPLLPPPASLMEQWAQYRDYDFSSGMGVRYVSDAPDRQSTGVWANDTTGYYYQGLTKDGRYYVSFYWPVRTEALPNSAAEALPAVQELANSPETHARYIQETRNLLNSLPQDAYTPNLSQLDAMIGTLAIGN